MSAFSYIVLEIYPFACYTSLKDYKGGSAMIPYFDTHCDTVYHGVKEDYHLRRNHKHIDLERLAQFDKAVQCFAIFNTVKNAPAGGMFALTLEEEAYFRRELAENTDIAAVCRTTDDIRKANAEGKVAAVLTIEGSELLNCDPEKIEWADEKGVRAISLTWNHPNFIAGTNLHETSRGLNDLGREFVRRCQEKDILVDVSHCSDVAFWDLMKITTKPILASHSNSRVLCNHSRNLTDDMFRAICETGGVVGLNYYAKFIHETDGTDMEAFLRHFDHFLELGGAKHIGLGSDLDGCNPLAGGMTGVQDVPKLYNALKERGYDDALLEDIFYNNFMRIF